MKWYKYADRKPPREGKYAIWYKGTKYWSAAIWRGGKWYDVHSPDHHGPYSLNDPEYWMEITLP